MLWVFGGHSARKFDKCVGHWALFYTKQFLKGHQNPFRLMGCFGLEYLKIFPINSLVYGTPPLVKRFKFPCMHPL